MKKVIKSISINEARINMILANTIRDNDGNILAYKDERLDYPSISQIRKHGINSIYIYQFIPTPPTKHELPLKPFELMRRERRETHKEEDLSSSNESDPELADNIDEAEEEIYSVPASPISPPPLKDVISIEMRKQGEQLVKDLFANPEKIKFNKVIELVNTIVEDILSTDETVISVQDLRDYDNYTYQHSVNLCVLGVTVGKLKNYSREQLKDFGVGLLFHDFGKTKIPLEILNKPGKLTLKEFEIIKKHPEYGYELLSKKYRLPEITKLVIKHHHERLDGSGYPSGLKGKDLTEWVQISTIVDIYDALTSDRIYKNKWTHQNAINFLLERSERWFNKEYIVLLKSTIPDKRDILFSLLDF